MADFPRVCDSKVGLKHQYGYCAAFAPSKPFADGFLKYDLEKNNSTFHNLRGGQGSEPVFVRNPGDELEDSGWVLSYVFRPETETSEIVILNAKEFEEEPVARIQLPVRVPAGFHGNWVPEGY